MPTASAGLLMYRVRDDQVEFLLVHPGGPFWKSKDAGAWTIPKGVIEPGEEPLHAARREFAEELGFVAEGDVIPRTPVKQKAGKTVHAWTLLRDWDPTPITINSF